MRCALFEINDSDEPEGEERFGINWSLSPTSPSNVILVEPVTSTITVPCKRERERECVCELPPLSLSPYSSVNIDNTKQFNVNSIRR